VRLVVFAGLPGTGKSTMARGLAARLGCPVFDKDLVREALFAPAHVEYSAEQDDRCIEAILTVIALEARADKRPFAILDGRCFVRAGQSRRIEDFARASGVELRWILMRADSALARRRLASGEHPAQDRDERLHARLEREAVAFAPVHLELSSDPRPPLSPAEQLEAALDEALRWVRA
jgi:adenylylsulfate kinase